MANPNHVGAYEKPEKGSSILARHQAKAKAEQDEREFAKLVKARDGHRCRWPEKHVCLGGPLEAAHVQDKSLCGPSVRQNGITVCPWIHRRGPESIHGKQLKVECETSAGTDGPVSFHRQTGEYDRLGQPIYYMVARETAPFQMERD